MVTPLEINVAETKVAVIIGQRDAKTHPSVALDHRPSRTTDHYTYEFKEGADDEITGRVLVSTRKKQDGRRDFQYVAVMVQGVDQPAVRQFAESLAEMAGVSKVVPAQHSAYYQRIVDFLGGPKRGIGDAVSKALGIETKDPYEWEHGHLFRGR